MVTLDNKKLLKALVDKKIELSQSVEKSLLFLYDYSKKTQKSLASVMNLTFLTLIF